MTRTRIAAIALISAIALLAAGLAGAGTSGKSSVSSSRANLAVSGSVTFDGIWTAGEAKAAYLATLRDVRGDFEDRGQAYRRIAGTLALDLLSWARRIGAES